MIGFLPVTRYRVHFHVAAGRPYSEFERTVLEAIAEGSGTLGELERVFCVHPRMLVEAVVTLMQAGWVALEVGGDRFVINPSGERAMREPNGLPRNSVISHRENYIVCERVGRQLARSREVTFAPRAEVAAYFDRGVLLRARPHPHLTEAGLVTPLLNRHDGEWIHSCGPIEIVRHAADFMVFNVDTASGTILGLPNRWLPALGDEILELARHREAALIDKGALPSDRRIKSFIRIDAESPRGVAGGDPEAWLADEADAALLVGSLEHQALLQERLKGASSYVAIVSAAVDLDTVLALEDDLRAAVARGVLIDVVWGHREAAPSDASRGALERLKKIAWDSHNAAGRGRLVVARVPSNAVGGALVCDVQNRLEAVVGSYEWLAHDGSRRDLSVALGGGATKPVARIAHLVADVVAADPVLGAGSGVQRLRAAASTSERRAVEAAAGAPSSDAAFGKHVAGRFFIGKEHHGTLATLTRQARGRIVLGSQTWGAGSEGAVRYLVDALRRGCSNVLVRFGSGLPESDGRAEQESDLRKHGADVRRDETLGACFVAIDEDVLAVTGCAWLSPSSTLARTTSGEIGVVLRGKGIASKAMARLDIVV